MVKGTYSVLHSYTKEVLINMAQFLNSSLLWLVIGVLLGLIISHRCTVSNVPEEVVIADVEYKYDTTIVIKTDTVVIDNSFVRVDTTKVYDTIYRDTYFEQDFNYKDGTAVVTTYGGFTDSIDLTLNIPQKTITVTETITNTKIKEYKNSIGLTYLYSNNSYALLEYGRNKGNFGIVGKVGIDINSKTPIIGVGGKINF